MLWSSTNNKVIFCIWSQVIFDLVVSQFSTREPSKEMGLNPRANFAKKTLICQFPWLICQPGLEQTLVPRPLAGPQSKHAFEYEKGSQQTSNPTSRRFRRRPGYRYAPPHRAAHRRRSER